MTQRIRPCQCVRTVVSVCPALTQVIFGTVNGAIGVMAVLSKDDFTLLLKVQHALAQVIKGVGGFRHEVRVLVRGGVHLVPRWASIECCAMMRIFELVKCRRARASMCAFVYDFRHAYPRRSGDLS